MIAYSIRFSTGFSYADQEYLSMAVVLTVVDVLVAVLFDTMHNILQRDRWMVLAYMVKYAVFALLAVCSFPERRAVSIHVSPVSDFWFPHTVWLRLETVLEVGWHQQRRVCGKAIASAGCR